MWWRAWQQSGFINTCQSHLHQWFMAVKSTYIDYLLICWAPPTLASVRPGFRWGTWTKNGESRLQNGRCSHLHVVSLFLQLAALLVVVERMIISAVMLPCVPILISNHICLGTGSLVPWVLAIRQWLAFLCITYQIYLGWCLTLCILGSTQISPSLLHWMNDIPVEHIGLSGGHLYRNQEGGKD